MKSSFEIERKFLIEYPDMANLEQMGAVRLDMVQTYLKSEEGTTSRVRMIKAQDKVCYVYTCKKRISMIKCIEEEKDISKDEYERLLQEADKSLRPIEKVRYKLPFGEHVYEIDIYPFWKNKAVMEVEIDSEEEEFQIPPTVKIIKEVTQDVRYKNFSLASGNIPED